MAGIIYEITTAEYALHTGISGKQQLTRHATMARLNRGIKMIQLKQALSDGEIIERYPDDEPYPSCLVIGWLETGDPLHIVCSRGKTVPELRIVTVYEPDDERWETNYKIRKVRK